MMKGKILRTISYIVAAIGLVVSNASSVGCVILWFDEPKMPESML
jgi:cyclic lactone autoinducer peptide